MALSWAISRLGRTRVDWIALIVGLVAGAAASSQVLRWTPAQRALIPPRQDAPEPTAARLRVLASNVQSGNQQYEDVLKLIERETPDIILLTEVSSRWLTALRPLAEQYPHHLDQPDEEGNFGIGVWSRWPIESGGIEGFGSPAPQVNIVLRMPTGRIRFLGLHPVPPVFPRYAAWRNRVCQDVAAMLNDVPERLPVIVAGDFNASRYAPAFQRLCREGGLYDAAYRNHLERTWPTETLQTFMAIGIDHVLVSDAWRVSDFRVGPDIGSDHYPLIADLELLPPAGSVPAAAHLP